MAAPNAPAEHRVGRPARRVATESPHRRQPPVDAVTLGLAFRDAPTAMIVTDQRLRIVAANLAFQRLSGLHARELIGTLPPVYDLRRSACAPCERLPFRQPEAAREVMLQRIDGSRCRTWMAWSRLDAGHGTRALRVASFFEPDLCDGELERWRHRARHDALTGLANRGHLLEELQRGLARAARHGQRLAILFIDLDDFKAVNDGFGHAAGDRLLTWVGACLRGSLRAGDFVARYSGDEFAVMIESPGHLRDAAAAAGAVAGALARGARDPVGNGPSITASIGIAVYPDHGIDATSLLQAADAAMYRAKRGGGNAVEWAVLVPSPARGTRQSA